MTHKQRERLSFSFGASGLQLYFVFIIVYAYVSPDGFLVRRLLSPDCLGGGQSCCQPLNIHSPLLSYQQKLPFLGGYCARLQFSQLPLWLRIDPWLHFGPWDTWFPGMLFPRWHCAWFHLLPFTISPSSWPGLPFWKQEDRYSPTKMVEREAIEGASVLTARWAELLHKLWPLSLHTSCYIRK